MFPLTRVALTMGQSFSRSESACWESDCSALGFNLLSALNDPAQSGLTGSRSLQQRTPVSSCCHLPGVFQFPYERGHHLPRSARFGSCSVAGVGVGRARVGGPVVFVHSASTTTGLLLVPYAVSSLVGGGTGV